MSQKQYTILAGALIVIIIALIGFWILTEPKTVESTKAVSPVVKGTNTSVASPKDNKVTDNLLVDEQLTENPMELKIETLVPGQGAEQIAAGQTAVVHYTGWLTDGTKFDSSVDRGTPFEFTLGASQVIPGWDQGVLGMKVGEKRKLTIPSNLAYGDAGIPGAIPGQATLVFEVELLAIK
jgi:FKBP-type peptidyl-prolyl cis-trans isomerase